jgi:hypothetical protein
MKSFLRFSPFLGAAILCLVSAQVPAQQMPQQPPPVFGYQPTARPTVQDVDPGVDHGNSDSNLPEEFQKQKWYSIVRSSHPAQS